MSDAREQRASAVPDPFSLILQWLNSLPIAISVMLALAILSALGTVIPQEHLAQVQMGQFSDLLIDRYGKSRADIIMMLGLHHIYFTWYFFVLLVWLSISAVVCNITRFKNTIRRWRMPIDKNPARYHSQRALLSEDATPEQAEQVLDVLRSKKYRIREETDDEGARYIYADAGFLKLWGLVLLHVSILILLVGGIYGKAVGVDGTIRLGDGEQKKLIANPAENKHPFVMPLLRNLKPLVYDLNQDRFRIDYDRKISMPEDIRTHVPENLQEYYLYFVKDFVSHLKVTVDRTGATKEQEITVNHPLIIDKLNIYQSSYQQQGYLEVGIDGQTRECLLLPGQPIFIGPDGCYTESMGTLFSLEKKDGFGAVGDRDISSMAMLVCEPIKAGDLYLEGKLAGYVGPLTIATAGVMGGGMSAREVISPDHGIDIMLPSGQIAKVKMSRQVENFSIFSYKRDPGIPILYFGWIAMIIGITLALYIPFTQVRMRIADDHVSVLLSGAGRKTQSPLYQRIHAILFPS